jgi:hypothetical protein
MTTTVEEIIALVNRLSPADQQRVLEFAKDLAQEPVAIRSLPKSTPSPGTPGWKLLRFTVSEEDAEIMEKALEDCENVDIDEW